MAFDVTGLSQHVKNDSLKLATRAVAEAKTAQALIASGNYQSGVKGFAAILKLDTSLNFQSGASCGRTAIGDITLSDKKLEVVPLKDVKNFCPKAFYNTYLGIALAKGQDPAGETVSGEVVDQITDKRVKDVAKGVEELLWKGDKSITGTTSNLRFVDGIRKQAVSASGSTLFVTSGTTTIQKLTSLYAAVPPEISEHEDFRIYIGEDLYKQYLIDIAMEKIPVPPKDDTILYGGTAKLFPTSGLNGSKAAYAMLESNLQLGMDGDSETEKFDLKFSMETEQWYQDVHFAVGISVVLPEEVYYATNF